MVEPGRPERRIEHLLEAHGEEPLSDLPPGLRNGHKEMSYRERVRMNNALLGRLLTGDPASAETLASDTGYPLDAVRGSLERLRERGSVETRSETETVYSIP